jgi:hypothetical protein
MTQIERLTRVEERVNALGAKVDDMDKKLDELLNLRNKGVGAFWVASGLFGTGIVTAFLQFLAWMKG